MNNHNQKTLITINVPILKFWRYPDECPKCMVNYYLFVSNNSYTENTKLRKNMMAYGTESYV
jgi:hypothetical protein